MCFAKRIVPLEVSVIVTHSTQPVLILLMEEILHQLIGSLTQYLQGFFTSQVVVWDF